ncbi:mannosyl-3-phosphoglycerate phosphatase [Thalassotalea sp. PP2-459]|uniref:HAD-IIB family hydrolase n=1 Tax=Thalassotalea sp. PP2-459 TaxID=1742724 RepID=UPI0009445CB1|nr:HAD-IIB family hydrolase [Thalassotalea sp. PP2-459]OKY25151.1 mannosyl-3-phosphoglycerate phosphatase [Thalassotalea sp. PP2-459]
MKNTYLIFSDLDGTLLDHETYSWQAAKPTLLALKAADIPLILNTSKTFVELEELRNDLALSTPFIVENGAAIYIPINYFDKHPEDAFQQGNYWVKTFCQPRSYWLSLLKNVAFEYQQYFTGFSQLTVNELVALTHLSEQQAKNALQREFSEPLHWYGTHKQRKAFIDLMSDYGANVLQGGRFLHISGVCDKGLAQHWLAERYREQYPASDITTIALGDSDNDIAMLETADIAVQIRSPKHDFPALERQSKAIQSDEYGPKGWAETLTHLLPFIHHHEVQHG